MCAFIESFVGHCYIVNLAYDGEDQNVQYCGIFNVPYLNKYLDTSPYYTFPRN